jgi:signal transduction histidine kinase
MARQWHVFRAVAERPEMSRSPLRAPPLDFTTFRSQETLLILLNLAAMAGLMSLHAVFQPIIGALSGAVALAFVLRFAMQMGEVALLNDARTVLSPRATWWYARASVIAYIAFAALVSLRGSGQESHYAVLMVVPVIAAAFRFSVAGLGCVLVAIVALTIGQLWLPPHGAAESGRLTETFEATTVSLIFLVVAAVVRLLAGQLWRREDELRKSRDRLVREEKLAALGRVASAIAHEVRNPVSMIAGAVAAARRPETPAAVREEVFDILSQESQRLERLTQDFLAYARNRQPQLRDTALPDALALVAGLVRPRAAELGIDLVTGSDDASVAVDPFQIQQALLNLALNGLEATPQGGRVELSARALPEGASFAVQDSGPAIPADSVARLGEPFFSTKPRGTGLGLAIARSIAEAHGGELTLASNLPGQVRFELRVAAPEAAA